MLWTDHTGRNVILGTVLRMDDGKVRLRRVDGAEILIAVEWLSEADRELLRSTGSLGGASAKQPEPATSPPSTESTTELTKARTWTDSTGQWQATFLGLQDGNVCLMKDDGTAAKVPLDRLSKADQEFVRSTLNAMRPLRDPAKPMLWTDHTGRSVILAAFLGMDDGKVRLTRVDGVEISVALEWLQEADRELLRGTGGPETGK
jgi:hypothetical protein